jgi:hypothetical protein
VLAADTRAVEDGRTVPALSIARIKSFYDGTLFYRLAREHARGGARSGMPGGRTACVTRAIARSAR